MISLKHIPSKKIDHTDYLSRLVSKNVEPLEDSVIATLKIEKEIKNIMCNIIQKLPVTAEDIQNK